MADGLNKVMLLGNLGADPELRFTRGGQAVMNLRMATTETYKDKDDKLQERTEWHNVVVWGKRAEGLGKILTKGDCIMIEGGLRTSTYDDNDGVKRYKTEIHALNVILCGGGKSAGKGDDRGHDEHRGEDRPPPRGNDDRGRGDDRARGY